MPYENLHRRVQKIKRRRIRVRRSMGGTNDENKDISDTEIDV
jgi:hypothetical protein